MTVPDELIQNWPAEIHAQLVEAVNALLATTPYLSKQQVQCSDIIACGSRVLGGYKENSDIDVVAYLDNYIPPTVPGRAYFRYRAVTMFEDLRVDVWLRRSEDRQLGIFPGHPDAPTPLGWRLPYYSLINKQLDQLNREEIQHYLYFRHAINPLWIVPDRRWEKLIVDVQLPV